MGFAKDLCCSVDKNLSDKSSVLIILQAQSLLSFLPTGLLYCQTNCQPSNKTIVTINYTVLSIVHVLVLYLHTYYILTVLLTCCAEAHRRDYFEASGLNGFVYMPKSDSKLSSCHRFSLQIIFLQPVLYSTLLKI